LAGRRRARLRRLALRRTAASPGDGMMAQPDHAGPARSAGARYHRPRHRRAGHLIGRVYMPSTRVGAFIVHPEDGQICFMLSTLSREKILLPMAMHVIQAFDALIVIASDSESEQYSVSPEHKAGTMATAWRGDSSDHCDDLASLDGGIRQGV